MKKILSIITLSFQLVLIAQEPTTFQFDAEINGLRSPEGKIYVQVFDKDKNVIQEKIVEITDNTCNFEFTGMEKGTYAIRYFHDEDNDSKFGTNFIGIPNEGFGYSNNAKGYFGEPDFEDWLFDLNENKALDLKITYLL